MTHQNSSISSPSPLFTSHSLLKPRNIPPTPPQIHSIKAPGFGAGHRCCSVSQHPKCRLPWLDSIMVALLSFVALLLLALLGHTSPVPVELSARGPVYCHTERAQYGVPVRNDVTRFVIKYADAQRWKPSTPVSVSQGLGLLQQVPTSSSYLVKPSLTSPICRTFPLLARSPAQVPRPRTAFIWLFMFPTPSAPVATLPLSSGSSSAPLSPATRSFFSGSMADRSRAVLRAILQSMAPTSPPRPSPLSRLSSTGLAV